MRRLLWLPYVVPAIALGAVTTRMHDRLMASLPESYLTFGGLADDHFDVFPED